MALIYVMYSIYRYTSIVNVWRRSGEREPHSLYRLPPAVLFSAGMRWVRLNVWLCVYDACYMCIRWISILKKVIFTPTYVCVCVVYTIKGLFYLTDVGWLVRVGNLADIFIWILLMMNVYGIINISHKISRVLLMADWHWYTLYVRKGSKT